MRQTLFLRLEAFPLKSLRMERLRPWVLPLIGLLVTSCASAPRRPPDELITSAEIKAMHQTVTTLSERVIELETKIVSMNQKLDLAQQAKGESKPIGAAKPGLKKKGQKANGAVVGMDGIPVERVDQPLQASTGQLIVPERLDGDPAKGFAEDQAVDAYRKSLVLFRGSRYNEAIQGFSAYLELHADHVLAGSAQYYIGLSYYKLKELKLALIEFQRVLTSYDRSPHAAATLRYMAEAEDQLSLGNEADQHRQLLASLFPSSPEALVASGGAPAFPAAVPPPPAEESEYPADLAPSAESENSEPAPTAPPAVHQEAKPPAKKATTPESKPALAPTTGDPHP